MLNEIEEFKAYTEKPVYKCSGKRDLSFLGRFSSASNNAKVVGDVP